MIRSIIVDDEVKSCNVLKSMLEKYCQDVEVIATAYSAIEGRDAIRKHKPDLVFLDIQMPAGSGFSMLMEFDEIPFQVIFVTAHDEYALRAIKFSALDYLLKPLNLIELREAMQRYSYAQKPKWRQDRLQIDELKNYILQDTNLHKIALPTSEEVLFVEVDSIIRLEADSNYTWFCLDGGKKIMVSQTLKNYEEMLEGRHFLRVHNSHIINLKKVKKYLRGKNGYAVMSDGVSVEISARKKDDFFARFKL